MSEKMNDGGPAFPGKVVKQPNPIGTDQFTGMTLREYHAAHAPEIPNWFTRKIGNVLKIPDNDNPVGYRYEVQRDETKIEHLTRWRYAYADAMLSARNKEPQP